MEAGKTNRILLVDDHPIVRDGLHQMIERDPSLEVCGEAGGADEALGMLDRTQPDLVTVDVFLEGMNGIELTKILLDRFPGIRILVISMHDETLYAERALRAGAQGYVMKQENAQMIRDAIHKVLDGGTYLSERLQGAVASGQGDTDRPADLSDIDKRLSDREMSIFRALAQGSDRKQIASALSISAKTVETHRANIKNKLSIARATDLADVARAWQQARSGNGAGNG